MSDITSIRLQDALNAIERNAHDGILTSEQVTEAYALADELGETVDRLQDEVAKLRELVDYMEPIAWYAASPNERKRMREMGIEASDAS
ncbi:MAG: hypothetical protein IJ781_03785 [Atopobiaceae bacterium]|nr:hypothetical protein [Atopobiaceae bacterium]